MKREGREVERGYVGLFIGHKRAERIPLELLPMLLQ
jgi:hypothetical protein